MKIVYISPKPEVLPKHQSQLATVGEIKLVTAAKLTEDQAIYQLKSAEILVVAPSSVPKLSQRIIDSLPHLKYITTNTVGYDWIDLEAAAKRQIPISNCKGANSLSVAEHTIGFILDLAKRITEFDRDVRNKGAYDFAHYKGFEISHKTLGIVGLGDIGAHVAKIAQGFSMNLLGYNRSLKHIPGIIQTDLKSLLKRSDIVTIHLPLTPETKHFIGKSEIDLMRPGSILINTAREEIWDKQAVIDGVKSGKLFGVGIETPILTPIPKDDPYLQYSNILVNPHNAFNTTEADKRVKDTWVENIISFCQGNPVRVVNGV